MSSTRLDTSTTPPLRIDGEMTIFRAAELKQQLMAEPGLAAIDLSGVTEIDTAGLQLLLMVQQAAQARQATLTLIQPSAAVVELIDLLALGPRLGLHNAKVAA